MTDPSFERKNSTIWIALPDESTRKIYRIDQVKGGERVGPPQFVDGEGNEQTLMARGFIRTHDGYEGKIIDNQK